jgi:hypothetical protein
MKLEPIIIGPELRNLRDIATIEKPLVVHVRLGDYKDAPNLGVLSDQYYKENIKEVMSKGKCSRIWLFSDETNLAIKIIPSEYLSNVRVIDVVDNSASSTLEAMRLGKSYIIANSTFSWWAAFLKFDTSAEVICPNPWFKLAKAPRGLIPDTWQKSHKHTFS